MKNILISLRLFSVFLISTGILFPALLFGIAQLCFPFQANGSLIRRANGTVIGSELIAQGFNAEKYFHPRRSLAGSGYDGASSGGSNLGPTSKKLIEGQPDDPLTEDVDESFVGLKEAAARYRKENRLLPNVALPADAVTFSASGLDPDISPENALLQAARVAEARGMQAREMQQLVLRNVQGRFLGIFGEPRVNVLRLNLLLDLGSSDPR